MDTKETPKFRDDIVVPRAIEREWRRAIRKGMEFLDRYYDRKDWVNDIDLETLDLNDATTCVAGQLFGSEYEAARNGVTSGYEWVLKYVVEHEPWAEKVSNSSFSSERYKAYAQELGFYAPTFEDEEFEEDPIEERIARRNNIEVADLYQFGSGHWELFTREWERAITKRRQELA